MTVFDLDLSEDQKRDVKARMKVPTISFAVLMALLAINILLGATIPFEKVWILETVVLATMVVVVLLLSMEVIKEPPLIRLYAVLGFCWVSILFTMTLIDYLTR